MDLEPRYAVIGRSDGEPTLYHMTPGRARAERLRRQRETMTGTPYYVVSLTEWHANPLVALQRAEAAAQSGAVES